MNAPVEDIAKYLDGSLTDEQSESLNNWRQETPENENYFQELSYIWKSSNQSLSQQKEVLAIDTESALQKVTSRIDNTTVVQLKPRRQILAIACGIAALIIAGIAFIQFQNSDPETILFVSTEKSKNIELPDGSIAWLEPNSQLSYTTTFLDNRSIIAEGEVYFDVYRDTERPFTISTPHLQVEVLGTSFVVKDIASENEAFVTVITGKVEVKDKLNDSSIILTKEQTGKYSVLTRELQIQETPRNINHLHQATQYVAFYDNNLLDIVSELDRLLGAKITIQNKALNNCLFTGQFKTNDIETILNTMQPIYNFSIFKKNNEYIISKGYCKK